MNLIILSVTLLVLPMASSFTPLLATKFEMPTFGKKVAAPTKALTKASTKVPKNAVKVPSRIASIALSAPSLPTPSVGSVFDGGIVGIAGKGMSLLSIPFGLEAKVQAAALGLVGEIVGSPFRFNSEDVRAELQEEISKVRRRSEGRLGGGCSSAIANIRANRRKEAKRRQKQHTAFLHN